jgi:hypothetical protein
LPAVGHRGGALDRERASKAEGEGRVMQANKSCQPTPGGRVGAVLSPSTRRGCTRR